MGGAGNPVGYIECSVGCEDGDENRDENKDRVIRPDIKLFRFRNGGKKLYKVPLGFIIGYPVRA